MKEEKNGWAPTVVSKGLELSRPRFMMTVGMKNPGWGKGLPWTKSKNVWRLYVGACKIATGWLPLEVWYANNFPDDYDVEFWRKFGTEDGKYVRFNDVVGMLRNGWKFSEVMMYLYHGDKIDKVGVVSLRVANAIKLMLSSRADSKKW